VWSGPVPPLADHFAVRPDTVPDLATTLVPGVTVALVPDQAPASAQDWRASNGKTQLARYFAESLWRSPGVDVLAWVVASSRASVLSGFVHAAAATGRGDAGDAESVAARFVNWLSNTARPWLVVLDDLRDAADLGGLWPSGPAGRLLITAASPAAVPSEHQVMGCRCRPSAPGRRWATCPVVSARIPTSAAGRSTWWATSAASRPRWPRRAR